SGSSVCGPQRYQSLCLMRAGDLQLQATVGLRCDFHVKRPLSGEVTEDKLAVLEIAREGPGVAIDPQNCCIDLRAFLVHDEAPRRLALRALDLNFPKPGNIGCVLVAACSQGWVVPLRLERIRTARAAAIGSTQYSIVEGRFQLRGVTVESQHQRAILERSAV